MMLHKSQNTTNQYNVIQIIKTPPNSMITSRNGVIDAKEIEQWRQILNEYEESLKEITTSKHEKKIDLKKIQEQINLLLQQKNDKYKSSTIERTGIYALRM